MSLITDTSLSASPSGAISSLLLAVLARARRITGVEKAKAGQESYSLPGAVPRIPASQVSSLPLDQLSSARRKKERGHLSRNGYKTAQSERMQQPIIAESMPMVHDRLPDASAWQSIDERLQKLEDDSSDKTPQISDRTASVHLPVAPAYSSSLSAPAPLSFSDSSRRKRNAGIAPQLEGVLRRRQLYCSTGFHIQIFKNGRVAGTRKDHDLNAILEYISVGVGLVRIRGVVSGLYLAMDSRGRLYGSKNGQCRDCVFRETLQENWYNTYSSMLHTNRAGSRPCLVSLERKHRTRQGCRTNDNHRFTHFLPRAVDPDKVPSLYRGILS